MGMRIPVSVTVSQVAHGATFEEILQDYPDLEWADSRLDSRLLTRSMIWSILRYENRKSDEAGLLVRRGFDA